MSYFLKVWLKVTDGYTHIDLMNSLVRLWFLRSLNSIFFISFACLILMIFWVAFSCWFSCKNLFFKSKGWVEWKGSAKVNKSSQNMIVVDIQVLQFLMNSRSSRDTFSSSNLAQSIESSFWITLFKSSESCLELLISSQVASWEQTRLDILRLLLSILFFKSICLMS